MNKQLQAKVGKVINQLLQISGDLSELLDEAYDDGNKDGYKEGCKETEKKANEAPIAEHQVNKVTGELE